MDSDDRGVHAAVGALCSVCGKHDLALGIKTEVLETVRRVLGGEHPET